VAATAYFLRLALVLGAFLTVSACRVTPLVGEGRPCSAGDPCGPGLACVAARCQAGGVDAMRDRAVFETSSAEQRLFDGSRPEAQPTDRAVPVEGAPHDLPSCGACPLGCDLALGRCKRLLPSGFDPAPFFDSVSAALAPTTGTLTFNTTTGEVTQATVTLRPAGSPGKVLGGIYWGTLAQGAPYPELAIFGLTGLTLPVGTTLAVTGDRALAIYLTGSGVSAIAGSVQALPAGPTAAAGGFGGGGTSGSPGVTCFGGEGKGGAKQSTTSAGGGGGGARGASGGAGGMTGGEGGTSNGAVTLSPLYGGCGGGAGGNNTTGPLGEGGGGGGAIQIASNGTLQISGSVTVPGAGGQHGNEGAGGGGSGGALLLEAPTVTVTGTVAANGGGGGGGDADGSDGQDGLPGLTAAAGGGAGGNGGAGGKGGVRGAEAGAIGGDVQDGGGGGGSVGRIRVNALTISLGASCSPMPSQSKTVGTF